MAYRKIDPRLWDDENFVELTTVEKLLWLYLLTGPHTTSLPGLWIVGIGELVDGLRLPEKSIRAGLDKLQAMRRLVLNPRLRLVRVPNAPRYNRPDNARVLKSWFRMWSDIPECQQKYDHLESLRASVFAPRGDEQPADSEAHAAPLIAQWKATFGAVVIPERYQCADRRPTGSGSEPGRDATAQDAGTVRFSDSNGSRTFSEPCAKGSSAPALVTASGFLDPGSQEEPPETARAPARDQGKTMGPEAAALFAKLHAHECFRTVATREVAEALAAQVTQGRATLAEAERAVDDAGGKETLRRAGGSARSAVELLDFLGGCIGRAANERGARAARAAPVRGPQPQPGPMQVRDKGYVPPEERETSLVD